MTDRYAFSDKRLHSLQLQNPPYMDSFDVTSLFTNIPVKEKLQIFLDMLYSNKILHYLNFDRASFVKMLELACTDIHFIYYDRIYTQNYVVIMGGHLGQHFRIVLGRGVS